MLPSKEVPMLLKTDKSLHRSLVTLVFAAGGGTRRTNADGRSGQCRRQSLSAPTKAIRSLCVGAAFLLAAAALVLPPEARAAFTNGGFETGSPGSAPPSWAVQTYLNPNPSGVTIQNPQTRPGLNLGPGGTAKTITLNSPTGPGTQPDPTLGATTSLRWPRYGNQ